MNKLVYTQIEKLTLLKTICLAFMLSITINSQAQMPGKMHFGIVYPLSTNGTHAPLDTNNFSIHLFAGVSAAEKGLSFAGFANVIRKDAQGSQFAGFANYIGGNVKGAQFAGFANLTQGDIKGTQFAGFVNTAQNVKGAQFAGFANTANHLTGAQFAGFLNQAKSIKGSQFAGFINVSTNGQTESQFAGFINIAKKVKGVQMAGFINIADSSDYPIGFLNLIKKGEKSISVTIDETQTTMLSFRSGGKVLYGIIGIGYNFKNVDEVYALELGLGAHFLQSKYFRLNTELVASTLESFYPGEYFKTAFKVMPAIKLFSGLELYGGPTLNFISTNSDEGKALYTKSLHSWNNKWGRDYNALYIGYNAGLQFNF